jgi:hypothetical protein
MSVPSARHAKVESKSQLLNSFCTQATSASQADPLASDESKKAPYFSTHLNSGEGGVVVAVEVGVVVVVTLVVAVLVGEVVPVDVGEVVPVLVGEVVPVVVGVVTSHLWNPPCSYTSTSSFNDAATAAHSEVA